MSDAAHRRRDQQYWTGAEMAIHTAIGTVEMVGAHPLLTEAVILLEQARNKVADYVNMLPVTGA